MKTTKKTECKGAVMHYIKWLIVLILVTWAPWSWAADAQVPDGRAATSFKETPATPATIEALRKGGFVLYMRHGYTDNSKPDRAPSVDLNDCTTQRPLTPAGQKLALDVGNAIRKSRIPLGEISVSPLCRTKETAAAAFGKNYKVDPLLIYTAHLTDEQKTPVIRNTRRLLSTPVPAGSNAVVVAHGPNLMDLMGYFPKEGTVVVFRPKGGDQFEYVASVPPALWPSLVK